MGDIREHSLQYQTGQLKTLTSADGITKDRIRRIKDDMKGNIWISFSPVM
jgi:hypothetical protein